MHAIHQVIIGVVAWFPLLSPLPQGASGEPLDMGVFAGARARPQFLRRLAADVALLLFVPVLLCRCSRSSSIVGVRGLVHAPGTLIVRPRPQQSSPSPLGIAMVQFLPTQELSALSAARHDHVRESHRRLPRLGAAAHTARSEVLRCLRRTRLRVLGTGRVLALLGNKHLHRHPTASADALCSSGAAGQPAHRVLLSVPSPLCAPVRPRQQFLPPRLLL